MKQVTYFLLRKLFLSWQDLADTFRVPKDRGPDSRHAGFLKSLAFASGRVLYRILSTLIKPSFRTRIRLWLVRLAVDQDAFARGADPKRRSFKSERLDGINLVGYLAAENGLGEAARSLWRAAETAGIKVIPLDFRRGCESRMEESVPSGPFPAKPYGVNLIHVNADQLPVLHSILGAEFFQGRYNIAYCVWEQEEFPEDCVPALDLVQETWTASTFCLDAISRKTFRPVLRLPHSVEPMIPSGLDRRALELPEDGFIFLTVLDFCSTPERKNPLGALEAYAMATERIGRTTYFVVKTVNAVTRPKAMQAMERLQAAYPSIILRDSYNNRGEVNALINACDCFVSLHRAEGFGLPIAEAMYMKKPVIATGWSGNMDFMNVNNSFPVRFELRPLDHDVGPYRKGLRWAEPDLGHAAELMAGVLAEPEQASQKGEAAGAEIRERFSRAAVGRLIYDRLDRIRRQLLVGNVRGL